MTDKGLMIGVKGLRRKGHEQVQGNYWVELQPITDEERRDLLQIPADGLAFEARLFDSENLRTFAETCERLLKAGIPWEAVERMVGSRPYTVGIGVFKKGEPSRMPPSQCGMKRAEADALKRRFDIGFADIPIEGEPEQPVNWVDVTEPKDPAQDAPPTSNAALDAEVLKADAAKAARAKTKAALEQSDKF